ncbi:MAG: hypothetical protein Kow00122_07840 [Thermoleophilia bacterium]
MDIGSEREPRLQIDDGEPFPILRARVDKELESSRLRAVTGLDGRPVALPVGATVTLYTGPSVVFVGKVQEDQSVLDLLSCQDPEDGEYVDF